jgi:hypothetical protein
MIKKRGKPSPQIVQHVSSHSDNQVTRYSYLSSVPSIHFLTGISGLFEPGAFKHLELPILGVSFRQPTSGHCSFASPFITDPGASCHFLMSHRLRQPDSNVSTASPAAMPWQSLSGVWNPETTRR